ncbi:MAG: hypothetical protein AAGC43_00970 [Bacteroidota bacterium]
MEFKSLTSELGQIFAVGIKLSGFVYSGFLIYAIVERIYGAIVVVIALMTIMYFAFLRKLLRSKKVEFSTKKIRVNGEEFNINQVSEVKIGVLILNGDEQKKVHFNHYYSHNRMNELKNILKEY